MKLIDDITGMSSGWVLDFTNSTFAEFFRDELGIDIEDETYNEGTGSKGKRLRAFLRKGQPLAVRRLLVALWEYREVQRINGGEAETIPNCRARMSAIVERLGGAPLLSFDVARTGEQEPESSISPKGPAAEARQSLQDEFLRLYEMEAQQRGYAFEKFLSRFFNAWGLDARDGFRNTGEQIDGSFILGDDIYLLEAKWHSTKTDASALHAFQGKLSERVNWARGLFVSYEGFSEPSCSAFTSRQVILMDGTDILDTLSRLHLDEVLRAKVRHVVERKAPLARTTVLFPTR
tara:strand:- start:189 stop:1061 length:873 start_codon:yes stop_codon:yes gene_type:complete